MNPHFKFPALNFGNHVSFRRCCLFSHIPKPPAIKILRIDPRPSCDYSNIAVPSSIDLYSIMTGFNFDFIHDKTVIKIICGCASV